MRYLKASILLGLLAAAAVSLLLSAGLLERFDGALRQVLSAADGAATSTAANPWQYVLVGALALASAWCAVDITRPSLKVVVVAGAFLLLFSGAYAAALYGVYFSPFAPAAAVAAAGLLGLAFAGTEAGQRKKRLRDLFGERLSREGFARLLNSDAPADFSGRTQPASLVWCEIGNRELLMENLSPADYVTAVNRFLHEAAEFLVSRGAYLETCDGEELRAFFGLPLPSEPHAAEACRAALALAARLRNLNLEFDQRFHQKIDFRLAVNSGEVVAAAYGSGRSGVYGASGPAVDFARTLCAANAEYGTAILLGPDTLLQAREAIVARPIDLLRAEGSGDRLEIYELLATAEEASPEQADAAKKFWEAMILWRGGRHSDALGIFRRLAARPEGDPVAGRFVRELESATAAKAGAAETAAAL